MRKDHTDKVFKFILLHSLHNAFAFSAVKVLTYETASGRITGV